MLAAYGYSAALAYCVESLYGKSGPELREVGYKNVFTPSSASQNTVRAS